MLNAMKFSKQSKLVLDLGSRFRAGASKLGPVSRPFRTLERRAAMMLL